MDPLSFLSFLSTIPTPPPWLFIALTLLTTTIYITTLISQTRTGRATAWLRPMLTTRRRRNLALAFYIAIIVLEFLQSRWMLAGDWGIVSGVERVASWVVAKGEGGAADGNRSSGWIGLLGALAGLAGRLLVTCNTGSMVLFWLGLAVKELLALDVDGDARRGAAGKGGEGKE